MRESALARVLIDLNGRGSDRSVPQSGLKLFSDDRFKTSAFAMPYRADTMRSKIFEEWIATAVKNTKRWHL